MAGRIWSVFLFTITYRFVINYIRNQEIHHHQKTFKQEYIALLEKFEIPFEERYLFDFFEQ